MVFFLVFKNYINIIIFILYPKGGVSVCVVCVCLCMRVCLQCSEYIFNSKSYISPDITTLIIPNVVSPRAVGQSRNEKTSFYPQIRPWLLMWDLGSALHVFSAETTSPVPCPSVQASGTMIPEGPAQHCPREAPRNGTVPSDLIYIVLKGDTGKKASQFSEVLIVAKTTVTH